MRSTSRVVAAMCAVTVWLAPRSPASEDPPATPAPDTDRRVLTTEHFVVTIIDQRDDPYDITSDHVIYIGRSKRTGRSIRLVGSTFHHLDADGTPAGFQGYIFHNGSISYRVYVSGDLEIRRGDEKILLTEHGKWDR